MKKNLKIKKTVQKAVDNSFKDGRLDGVRVRQYIATLKNTQKIEGVLFLKEYYKRLQNEVRNKTLLIESPSPLQNDQMERISGYFKKNYPVYRIEVKLNPSLLGGIRVKIADIVFDDTVSSKIEEVGKRIGGV